MDKAWYAAQVLSGAEREVRKALERAGFETKIPVRAMNERRGGAWHIKYRTAIPGYVFIKAGAGGMTAHEWREAKSVPGLIRILGSGRPEEVPSGQMEIIHMLSHADNLIRAVEDPDGRKTAKMPARMREAGARIVSADMRARRAVVEVTILDRVHRVQMGIF